MDELYRNTSKKGEKFKQTFCSHLLIHKDDSLESLLQKQKLSNSALFFIFCTSTLRSPVSHPAHPALLFCQITFTFLEPSWRQCRRQI